MSAKVFSIGVRPENIDLEKMKQSSGRTINPDFIFFENVDRPELEYTYNEVEEKIMRCVRGHDLFILLTQEVCNRPLLLTNLAIAMTKNVRLFQVLVTKNT